MQSLLLGLCLLTGPANSRPSQALANRVWGWLMEGPIVSPVDDLGRRNLPSNKALPEHRSRHSIAKWRIATKEGPSSEVAFWRATSEAQPHLLPLLSQNPKASPRNDHACDQDLYDVSPFRAVLAVLEDPKSRLWFRLAGPPEAVAAHREAFVEFLKAIPP